MFEDLGELVGKEVGTSDWRTITQERVNLFAVSLSRLMF
jgi:acyl dehydratase